MTRSFVIALIVFGTQFASADQPPATVASAHSHVAGKQAAVIGCGLVELASSAAGAVEAFDRYDAKALAAETSRASAGKRVPVVGQVWSWCVKPDVAVRVWSACSGSGDSRSCGLFAATLTSGKLGLVSQVAAGWAPPSVEDIAAADAPSLWTGRGLKVTIESGRGRAVFGAYLERGAIQFTKAEPLHD
jgi:hypothetical protein